MKIMYIIHSCIMGGATISFLNLVNGVINSGIEVVVIHPKPLKEDVCLIERLREMGCHCIQLGVVESGISKSKNPFKRIIKFCILIGPLLLKKTVFLLSLKKVVKKESPDIIHSNSGVIHEGYKIALKYGIPHIWHLREYQTKDFNIQVLPSMNWFRRALKKSYSVCITKDIQKFFDLLNEPKSFVIYNPAMALRDVTFSKEREKYFLVANRLSVEKGIEDIIDAFNDFVKHNNDYKLKLAGFGNESYISLLRQRIIKYNIEDKVIFLGYTNQIPVLMQKAKALIVASYNEGFGRMSAEANMLGLPVLGRDTAGTKEVIDLTCGGIKFVDKDGLCQAMIKISNMDDKEISLFMSEPQKKAANLFSSEQHLKNILTLYNKILQEK